MTPRRSDLGGRGSLNRWNGAGKVMTVTGMFGSFSTNLA